MKDWTGARIGRWTVIEHRGETTEPSGSRFSLWLCRCSCGTEKVYSSHSFGKRFTSCGCQRRERLTGKPAHHRKDLRQQRFGRLVAIERLPTAAGERSVWRCECDCGNEAAVSLCNLVGGHTNSCGCLLPEIAGKHSITHGMANKVPEYGIWAAMRRRCDYAKDKHFADYGGRGIRVCERWQSFAHFYEDMGPRPSSDHSIDRYPNKNGNYEPGNARWATRSQQARNTRTNRIVEYQGRRQTLADWCDELHLPYFAVSKRLRAGWSAVDAFTKPLKAAPAAHKVSS